VVNVFMAEQASKTSSSLIMPGEATSSCWSCGDMRAAHFCSACGKVQPPAPVDYFTFFGLPRKLHVDVKTLEREFYELSRRLHPDMNARTDFREQAWSLEKSSQLNDAYRTLKDPIRRTEYLLKLEGVQLEEQSKEATEKARDSGAIKQQVVPPELLEEVFELNVQLEELRANKRMGEDDPGLVADLQKQKATFENKQADLMDELEDRWSDWDKQMDRERHGEPVAEEDRKAIRNKMVDVLNRRNYVRNLVRDVNEALGN
jgi:molecular chaperone HscB